MTPKFTFRVGVRDLCAMRLLVSKDETRFVLNGACCRFVRDELYLISTDGRRMGVLRAGCSEITGDSPPEIILALGDFRPDLTAVAFDERVTVEVFESEAIVRLTRNAWVIPVIDLRYPAVDKVLSIDPPEPVYAISVNGSYARSFGKISLMLTGSTNGVTMRFTGDKAPIEIRIRDPRFYGVLMPLTENAGQANRPGWLSDLGVGATEGAFK